MTIENTKPQSRNSTRQYNNATNTLVITDTQVKKKLEIIKSPVNTRTFWGLDLCAGSICISASWLHMENNCHRS